MKSFTARIGLGSNSAKKDNQKLPSIPTGAGLAKQVSLSPLNLRTTAPCLPDAQFRSPKIPTPLLPRDSDNTHGVRAWMHAYVRPV
jgi:hypothetical protein